jgi:hypothetical protein
MCDYYVNKAISMLFDDGLVEQSEFSKFGEPNLELILLHNSIVNPFNQR